MNQAIKTFETITDHCRFLLMEMGIGMLHQTMDRIIQPILGDYQAITAGQETNSSLYDSVVIKALSKAYDNYVMFYAKQSGLIDFDVSFPSRRPEQLLFLQQLTNRIDIDNHPTPLQSHFTIREATQFLPAFQAKIKCYGIQQAPTTRCVPVHPWLWRKKLKNHYQSDVLPCLHHKKQWHASHDAFYLQDNDGHFLSFYD